MPSAPIKEFFSSKASERDNWKAKNRYYHQDIESFIAANIPSDQSVLEIGCGTGDLTASLKSSDVVGLDFSEEMVLAAQSKYPGRKFVLGDAENLSFERKFDFIVLSDVIGLLPDVQAVFEQLKPITTPSSRVLITYHNYIWEPVLTLLEKLGLKMPQPAQNWLPLEDIQNILYLSGFEVIRKGYRLLFPYHIPFLSTFLNRFVAKLPLIDRLCLVEWIIAKPVTPQRKAEEFSCSVIIPCRNERDNIRDAVTRTAPMGKKTELIFVDGSSTDGTLEEIEKVMKEFPERNITLIHQGDGKGKCDAVQKGFNVAKGDIYMILDSDLTVPPEDLPKFFNALIEGKGEFINGTRLVYPMEKQAMRFLNLLGNKFFGMAFSYLLEQRFTDTLCGTKVLWAQDYEKIKRGRSYFGDFDPFGDFDLIFGASKQNLQIVELPVRYRERVYGTTKIRRFAHGWLLLQMCWIAAKKLKFV